MLTQKMGVNALRLASFGNGPYSPIASNATEEGRTHNRRVELVAPFIPTVPGTDTYVDRLR